MMDEVVGCISGAKKPKPFKFPKYTHLFASAHNILVYQEHFMGLAMEMCGFTEIDADKLRKATGKKDINLLLSLKDKFISGAVANGENRKDVEAFWEELLGFASYSFNA